MNQRKIGLDLARIAAMVLVWINHSGCFALGMDPGRMEFAGIFCIEVFFTLSGFLVGKQMLRLIGAGQPGAALKRFYVNRLVRTVPMYYLALVLMWILSSTSPSPAYLLFLQNGSGAVLEYFPPMWSMPVEIWFYILTPPALLLLVRLFSRRMCRERAVFAAVGLLCLIPFLMRTLWVIATDPAWDHGVRKQVLLRMDSPMMGVFLAAVKEYAPRRYQALGKKRWHLPASLAGIVLLYIWFVRDLREHFDDAIWGRIFLFTLLPLFCCQLLLYLDNARWPDALADTVAGKWIRELSAMGYSVYLLHWIVFQWIAPYFADARFLVSWAGFALAVGLTLAGGWVAYRFIELPLDRWKKDLLTKTTSRPKGSS